MSTILNSRLALAIAFGLAGATALLLPINRPPLPRPMGGGRGEELAGLQSGSEAARDEIARLNALAMKGDANSRNQILAALQHPHNRIRMAALEATVQLSDRSVIPHLEEIARNTTDFSERARILNAIDYIKLPSLTEYLSEQTASTNK